MPDIVLRDVLELVPFKIMTDPKEQSEIIFLVLGPLDT